MQFDSHRRRFSQGYIVVVLALGILFLPTAPAANDNSPEPSEQDARTTTNADDPEADSAANKKTPPRPQTLYPQILETLPAAGSTGIDPHTKEIRVTFDRDMGKGMSWTGGGPDFPPVDKSRQVRWIGERTCILPVTLERRKYYRVGINSRSHQNFKDEKGTPAPPAAIFFTTKGAGPALENRVRIPQLVESSPANGAKDVPPGTTELRVTFNMPMSGGMSWTGGGQSFPGIADGRKAQWSKDGRTCSLPVSLLPDHAYKLGLNSLSHKNFQSKWGVPLKPVVYTFRTAGKAK